MSTVLAAHNGTPGTLAAPAWLALSLRERHWRLRTGELDARAWAEDSDRWARSADERYQACAELRPVAPDAGSIRIGVKDTVDATGFATRLGPPGYRRYPDRSAAVLRDVPAAAVVAKVATAQLGLGLGTPCANPRFPHLSPSGSSTGSAVAVAAGICDLTVGTDSTGSIRLPASACGVTGLRLTHDPGRLEGILPLCPMIDSPGWLARTPDDLAFAWNELRLGARVPAPGRRYRIGVPDGLRADGCLPRIVDELDRVAARLAAAGHTVTRVDIADLLPWRQAVWELVAYEAGRHQAELAARLGAEVSASVHSAYGFGRALGDERLAAVCEALVRVRAGAAARFERAGVDAWLLPTTSRYPGPAGAPADETISTIPDFDDPAVVAGLGYATVASFAGLPAITVPAAVDTDLNAPISVQLIGPPNSEAALLDAAREVAAAADGKEFP